ncbi:MAG: nucleotidyltransferase domain-containing protein [bacterium]
MPDKQNNEKVNKILEEIIKVIVEHLNPEKVILFGSRAEGSFHRGSDIDIAILGGKKLSFREERKLKEIIDEVAGIYSVDILFMERLESDFAKRILETGKVVYENK